MALTHRLADTVLRHPCPRCGHILERRGKWFMMAGRYTCSGCSTKMQMRYEMKVKLFDAAQEPGVAHLLRSISVFRLVLRHSL